MEYGKFYEKFLEMLASYYPKRSRDVKELAEHLRMDQKNLARRMRGETPFTVEEITKICAFRKISFDSLLFSQDEMVHPMKILMRESASLVFPESFQNLFNSMEYIALDRDNGKVFFCSNFIPNGMYTAYPTLARFFYYLWEYRRFPERVRSIEYFHIPAEMQTAIARYGTNVRSVKSSVYLFSENFIENISAYILSAHVINPFPPETSLLLVEELVQLLDEIEHCALHGTWPGTDNRVYISVTRMILPNGILIAESSFYNAAILYSFFLNPIITVQPETFAEIRSLTHTLLRYAENISVSGEKSRAVFMEKQRTALQKLKEGLTL